jgi:hypothetical protein
MSVRNTTCKDKRKEYDLFRNYRLTSKEYLQMLADQDFSCAICSCNVTGTDKVLVVDHNHETGEVRGLLCSTCNTGLGMFKDSINNLSNAMKYLKRSVNEDSVSEEQREAFTELGKGEDSKEVPFSDH